MGDIEQFFRQNGFQFVAIDAAKDLKSGDHIVIMDHDKDGGFCCATVLRDVRTEKQRSNEA